MQNIDWKIGWIVLSNSCPFEIGKRKAAVRGMQPVRTRTAEAEFEKLELIEKDAND